MAPLFKPGDMLCVKPRSFCYLHKGDVVVFYLTNKVNNPLHVVHRIISITRNGLITQGDNNPGLDTQEIPKNNLIGLVTSFERKGMLYSVRGGGGGLLHIRIIQVRRFIMKMLSPFNRRIHSLIRRSGLVPRVWRPVIIQIHLMTDHGPLVKYCFGTKTVASWWPQQKFFAVVKPFDLIIIHPEDPK